MNRWMNDFMMGMNIRMTILYMNLLLADTILGTFVHSDGVYLGMRRIAS